MIWQDVLIERHASACEIRKAIVAAGVAERKDLVDVVGSMEFVDRSSGVRVVCERTAKGGQFPLQLTIYVFDAPPSNVLESLARFSEALQARCLIAADSEDPYRMVLVTPGGESEVVDVDEEALDEREEYVLTS